MVGKLVPDPFIEYTKYGGKISPRPFYRKSKLSIPLHQQSEMLHCLLLLYAY